MPVHKRHRERQKKCWRRSARKAVNRVTVMKEATEINLRTIFKPKDKDQIYRGCQRTISGYKNSTCKDSKMEGTWHILLPKSVNTHLKNQ